MPLQRGCQRRTSFQAASGDRPHLSHSCGMIYRLAAADLGSSGCQPLQGENAFSAAVNWPRHHRADEAAARNWAEYLRPLLGAYIWGAHAGRRGRKRAVSAISSSDLWGQVPCSGRCRHRVCLRWRLGLQRFVRRTALSAHTCCRAACRPVTINSAAAQMLNAKGRLCLLQPTSTSAAHAAGQLPITPAGVVLHFGKM